MCIERLQRFSLAACVVTGGLSWGAKLSHHEVTGPWYAMAGFIAAIVLASLPFPPRLAPRVLALLRILASGCVAMSIIGFTAAVAHAVRVPLSGDPMYFLLAAGVLVTLLIPGLRPHQAYLGVLIACVSVITAMLDATLIVLTVTVGAIAVIPTLVTAAATRVLLDRIRGRMAERGPAKTDLPKARTTTT